MSDSALPVWLELHVDDELLSRDASRWPEARDLIERVARLAESRGARLCFRFREHFALLARGDSLLCQLEAAGHELGVHAHGQGLARATQAVRSCGVEPRVAVPGLVQAGPEGRELLLRQAAALGFSLVTDHEQEKAWAYEGLVPRIESGVVVMAPTVRPTDWGLISARGRRQGLRAEQVPRLRELERRASEQGAQYFGLALHEHDLCAPESLEPLPEALQVLGSWLDARVGPSMDCGPVDMPPPLRSTEPLSDRRTFLVRQIRSVVGAGRGGVEQVSHRLRRAGRLRLRSPQLGEGMEWVSVGDRKIAAWTGGARDPSAICLISHAGLQGGIHQGLRPFGLAESDLAREGWALWLYDRAGTGASSAAAETSLAPGNPAHVEDWRTMLRRARQGGLPVVALSWSAGIIPVLRAAVGGECPDALVDGEGPADRWSLVPPRGPKAKEMGRLDPWDDDRWIDLEPVRMITRLDVPYARLQAEEDHVHGPMNLHAARMGAAVEGVGMPQWPSSCLSGLLHRNPEAVLSALNWARNQVQS